MSGATAAVPEITTAPRAATAIRIEDMHCAACVRKVSNTLASLAFVDSFQINPVRRQVHVSHHASDGDFQLLRSIESLGFTPTLKQQSGSGDRKARGARIKRLGVAGICAMQVMMASVAIYFGAFWGMDDFARRLLNWAALIFCLPIIGYCATPFFSSAGKALQRRSVNMDVPVALALACAFAVSLYNLTVGNPHVYFDSVAMFTFLLLGARQIDATLRARVSADDQLFASAPVQVQRLRGQLTETCLLADVRAGDVLRLGEGALIPVDAQLQDPQAVIDEASFSGESAWVHKQRGATLFAGTYNRGAALLCQATARASDSRAAQIERLADRINLSKAPLARLADRVAGWFVPAIIAAALATTLGWWLAGSERALSTGLAVLIVSCPCALALAIPAALAAAMARLRRLGILLTDSSLLELTPAITQLYFDKTGTLTMPQLTLLRTETLGDLPQAECLALARALQSYSSHPIARAFTETAAPDIPPSQDARYALTQVTTLAGQGVRARLATEELRIGSASFCGLALPEAAGAIYLSLAALPLARFELGAPLRPDTRNAIDRLQQLDLQITMLSGDQQQACAQVAKELGIDFAGALSPEAKLQHLRGHRGATDKVMFIGDGINDALAFSDADIAIATLETSDLVRAQAGATLLTARLGAIADLFDISVRTQRVMRQNLCWALLYNLIAIPSAMAGLMPPWLAAIGMATSSILVMLNATRLLRGTQPQQPTEPH